MITESCYVGYFNQGVRYGKGALLERAQGEAHFKSGLWDNLVLLVASPDTIERFFYNLDINIMEADLLKIRQ